MAEIDEDDIEELMEEFRMQNNSSVCEHGISKFYICIKCQIEDMRSNYGW